MDNLIKNGWKKYQKQGGIPLFINIMVILAPYQFAWLQSKKLRLKYGEAAPDPWKKIQCSPMRIKYSPSLGYNNSEEYIHQGGRFTTDTSYGFDRWMHAGEVRAGAWDTDVLDIHKLPRFLGIKERFVDSVPWENTTLFEYYYEIIDKGHTIDGCSTKAELLDRYQTIDQIYSDIRTNGYKSQEEIRNTDNFRQLMREPFVYIDRNGDFILGDGHHRTSIAKILDIETIPVRVIVRHKRWQHVREQCYNAHSVDQLSPTIRKLTDHPDLQDVLPSE